MYGATEERACARAMAGTATATSSGRAKRRIMGSPASGIAGSERVRVADGCRPSRPAGSGTTTPSTAAAAGGFATEQRRVASQAEVHARHLAVGRDLEPDR